MLVKSSLSVHVYIPTYRRMPLFIISLASLFFLAAALKKRSGTMTRARVHELLTGVTALLYVALSLGWSYYIARLPSRGIVLS